MCFVYAYERLLNGTKANPTSIFYGWRFGQVFWLGVFLWVFLMAVLEVFFLFVGFWRFLGAGVWDWELGRGLGRLFGTVVQEGCLGRLVGKFIQDGCL